MAPFGGRLLRSLDLRLVAFLAVGIGVAWLAERYADGAEAAAEAAAPAFDRAAWRAWAAGLAPADLGPPATEAEVAAAEARLGTTFPPSYRAFLLELGALKDPHFESPFTLPVGDVQWLRDADPELIATWLDPKTAMAVGVPAHQVAGLLARKQDGYVLGHLRETLLVSATASDGGETYLLLDPAERSGEEWQAWEFASWIPGAHPYANFSALLTESAGFARSRER